ncbi:Ribonuclease MRP protein subunit rmp1 [Microsporum audouinii]
MSTQLTELPPSSSPFAASSDVRSIHRTLHLLYHRNKNQHRCTKWWKWLSMLKRWTLELACEIEKIEKFEDVLSGDGTGDEHPFAAVWKIMRYLHDELVPRCYRAFSTVVADIQFSSLGIVLVATLAEVFKIVQVNTGELSALARVLDDEKGSAITPKSSSSLAASEDFGEVVRRSEVVSQIDKKARPAVSMAGDHGKKKRSAVDRGTKRKIDSDTVMATALDKPESSRKEKKEKKKKRKANAIDDIFAGL